ncbi:MAG TPA: M48 family metallopeptidase [Pyrinomonadaceae bacterium]|nr:M48 family metallopeptidase [Pyrinomonadaceae bacterium]
MLENIARRFGASLLVASLWITAIAFVPAISIAQTSSTDASTAKKGPDSKDSKKSNVAPTTPTGGSTANTKPLSVKEDPAMIGKRNINSGDDKLFGWLGGSREKEMQIGRQLAMEVEQQSKMVDDPIVTEYVNRVGQNIVLHSDAKVPFTIKVVDSDEVNAFALPGGFFFVNKGLILAADNEAELAGVMAHEIAHVAARHAMENQGKAALINWASIAGIIFGGPIVSQVLYNGGGILAGLAQLKFSRSAEEEADMLGVEYLYASGYDPTGMSTMFEKLASQNKKKAGAVTKLFSTHPQSVDRRDASLALVARFPEKDEYIISTSEFQRVKAHLLKISNAKAGITADYDDQDNSKPTLKRRQPESTDAPTDSTSGGSSSSTNSQTGESSSSDKPPQLKKRDGTPEASPTPKRP